MLCHENKPDRLIPSNEAAKLLGIAPKTLTVWRSTGRYKLPFVKCGSKVMYKLNDLQQFIEERTFVATPSKRKYC